MEGLLWTGWVKKLWKVKELALREGFNVFKRIKENFMV
jgi:hypothetical protein